MARGRCAVDQSLGWTSSSISSGVPPPRTQAVIDLRVHDYDRPMRYDIYGRFLVEVRREADRWVAYRLGEGVRRLDPDVQLPPEISADAIAGALEDVFHEFAQPGRSIRELPTGEPRP